MQAFYFGKGVKGANSFLVAIEMNTSVTQHALEWLVWRSLFSVVYKGTRTTHIGEKTGYFVEDPINEILFGEIDRTVIIQETSSFF